VNSKHAEPCKKSISILAPSISDEISQRIDSPLQTCIDESGNCFVKSEFNKYHEYFRSPFTNEYSFSSDSSIFSSSDNQEAAKHEFDYPSPLLRSIETKLNYCLELYCKQYYDPGFVYSAYIWEMEEDSFCCAVLTRAEVDSKKMLNEQYKSHNFSTSGDWNSISIISVEKTGNEHGEYIYKCYSNLFININTSFDKIEIIGKESIETGGYNMIEREFIRKVDPNDVENDHCVNIGEIVEGAEGELRNKVVDLFISRIQGCLDELVRNKEDAEKKEAMKEIHEMAAMAINGVLNK